MLTGTRSGLRNKRYTTHMFATYNGVVQGSVISPTLYGVFINDLVVELNNSKIGANIGDEIIAGLFYCDDIALTAHSAES